MTNILISATKKVRLNFRCIDQAENPGISNGDNINSIEKF